MTLYIVGLYIYMYNAGRAGLGSAACKNSTEVSNQFRLSLLKDKSMSHLVTPPHINPGHFQTSTWPHKLLPHYLQ